MRTFALLYNLSCGTGPRAQSRLQRLRHAFRARGVELRTYCSSTPVCAPAVVSAATAGDCEAILAAGGDGTFNELLQAAMRQPASPPIGIVPFGSGNVLSRDIGLSGDLAQIAQALTDAVSTNVPVGMLSSRMADGELVQRYFTVAAGIGADARVICGVNQEWKKRFGIAAYYTEATRQLLFSPAPLPLFLVRYLDLATGDQCRQTVSQVIVERVGYFSGPLIQRNGSAPLLSHAFRLVLFKTQSRATYLRYGLQLLASRFRFAPRSIGDIEVAHATSVICDPLPETSGADVLTEVDGELVGGLPAELSFIPQGIRMLLPRRT
jgi:diacylglycerol kinase (ATP)